MTAWRNRPEIEPLGEATWQRVERAVFADLEKHSATAPSKPRFSWRTRIGLPVLAAAVAMTVVILWVGSRDAPLSSTPLRVVAAQSPTQFTIGRASLELAPETAIWVHNPARHGVTVILERGEVECAVAPAKRGSAFVVQAGNVRIEVVGTRFAVSRAADSVQVTVSKGTVHVFAAGERTVLHAGQAWNSDQPVSDFPPLDSEQATLAPRSQPTRSARRAHKPRRAGHKGRKVASSRSPAPRSRDHHTHYDSPDRSSPNDDVSTKERYDTAARLEGSDPEAAIVIYRQLTREGGGWAAPALFANARLEVERGRRKVALTLLQTYLDRFPNGQNAADAQKLVDELD